MKDNITKRAFEIAMVLIWLWGVLVLGAAFGWRAGVICWIASCCFATVALVENE